MVAALPAGNSCCLARAGAGVYPAPHFGMTITYAFFGGALIPGFRRAYRHVVMLLLADS